eukprot:s1418_g16.t1
MAPQGRIVVAPHAPQRILDLYRSLESPRRSARGATPRRRAVQRKRRPSSAPAARQVQRGGRHEDHNSSSWSIGTLFCKERVGVGHLLRPSACTFRRPQSAGATGSMTAPPHQRPVSWRKGWRRIVSAPANVSRDRTPRLSVPQARPDCTGHEISSEKTRKHLVWKELTANLLFLYSRWLSDAACDFCGREDWLLCWCGLKLRSSQAGVGGIRE